MYVATAFSVARQAHAVNVPSSCCAIHASQPLSWVETHNRIGCVCWWSVTSTSLRSIAAAPLVGRSFDRREISLDLRADDHAVDLEAQLPTEHVTPEGAHRACPVGFREREQLAECFGLAVPESAL